jgi:hypothetical protein
VDHVWWRNEGFRRAAILNEAVRRSAGEPLLVFTDGDCVPPTAFLAGHVSAHGPRTFAVGGARKLTKGESAGVTEAVVAAGGHERLGGSPTGLSTCAGRAGRAGSASRCRPRRPKVVSLNIGIDRALFEEVNGYDEGSSATASRTATCATA